MNDLGPAMEDLGLDVVQEVLTLNPATREAVKQALSDWLTKQARKRPASKEFDQQAAIDRMQQKLARLAKELEVTVSKDRVTLTATTVESQEVIVQLDRGSEWFGPHPNLVKAVVDAILAR